MAHPEKFPEPFIQTLIRTIVTSIIIALILSWFHLIPSPEKSRLTRFALTWPAVFCIVFAGHWLELLYINYLKFSLPKNILALYVIRIGYWFLCAIPLWFLANVAYTFCSHTTGLPGRWWAFGLLYVGIELLMHAIMQLRVKKSFYNGVY